MIMPRKLLLLITIVIATCFTSCEPDDDLHVPDNLKSRDFVWKGMNLYYLWQEDVDDLSDSRFDNQDQLNGYLSDFPNPESLFQNLRVDNSIDRFSVIYSDYRVLEGVLSGTTGNNGVDFGLKYINGSTTQIFGWVRYILPGSDASEKNIHRGDIFYAVNGISLTTDNYQSLLSPQTYTLNLADYDNGSITPNGQSVTLTKQMYSENPILVKTIINSGNHKIAYLMYNGFYQSYDSELNIAFSEFKAQGATDLVLDLRYNSGGSIATATRLASLITGQFSGQLFAREQWNEKAQNYFEVANPANLKNNFTALSGSLNLSTVYVLTSRSTASASELVINGLAPYINVVQIGDYTTGKNVGSITLYDSPDFTASNRNPDHRYAMQPIVLKIVNKNGFGDYLNGLLPDYEFLENLNGLGVLGSPDEPMLETAIGYVTGNGKMIRRNTQQPEAHFSDNKLMDPIRSQMYK